ncbi:hypothetical protein [Thermoactinospora rubra]|uniref:hypothetical protein n=1 Tax=Thermoactinospora rubra TaxID=1088767 RepID=UPI000A0F934A|nr:hypothetical protein [Thermoactinospora rubra]
MLNDLLQFVTRQPPAVVWPLVFVFLTLDASVAVGLVIPGDWLLILSGTTADGPAEAVAPAVVAVLACLAGATGGHWLGRRYGSRLKDSRLGRRVGRRRWEHADWLLPVLAAVVVVVVAVSKAAGRALRPRVSSG